MIKLISLLLMVSIACFGQTIYYNVMSDASGNIRGLSTIKSVNDIATASDLLVKATVVAGSQTNGNLVTISGINITDTGISPSNLYWQLSYDNIAEVLASVGQANGIAQLNASGKIDASLIETITVVFSGGQAVDVP
jgi:hypothetical protein